MPGSGAGEGGVSWEMLGKGGEYVLELERVPSKEGCPREHSRELSEITRGERSGWVGGERGLGELGGRQANLRGSEPLHTWQDLLLRQGSDQPVAGNKQAPPGFQKHFPQTSVPLVKVSVSQDTLGRSEPR